MYIPGLLFFTILGAVIGYFSFFKDNEDDSDTVHPDVY